MVNAINELMTLMINSTPKMYIPGLRVGEEVTVLVGAGVAVEKLACKIQHTSRLHLTQTGTLTTQTPQFLLWPLAVVILLVN